MSDIFFFYQKQNRQNLQTTKYILSYIYIYDFFELNELLGCFGFIFIFFVIYLFIINTYFYSIYEHDFKIYIYIVNVN